LVFAVPLPFFSNVDHANGQNDTLVDLVKRLVDVGGTCKYLCFKRFFSNRLGEGASTMYVNK